MDESEEKRIKAEVNRILSECPLAAMEMDWPTVLTVLSCGQDRAVIRVHAPYATEQER